MKNYFGFTLTGAKLFWVIILYLIVVVGFVGAQAWLVNTLYMTLGRVVLYILALLALYFFLYKLTIEGITYCGENVQTSYKFTSYVWLAVKGVFFSIITLGIYYPWFIVRLIRYFAHNASIDGKSPKFNGSGLTLFALIITTFVIPYIALAFFFASLMGSIAAAGTGSAMLSAITGTALLSSIVLVFALMILMSYLFIKWFIDFTFGGYHVTFKAQYGPTVLFMLGQSVLTAITLGLYYPAAMVRVYRYIAHRTVGEADAAVKVEVGYDGNIGSDYLYILGQILLSIITLAIYSPWAYTNIIRRLLSQTYTLSETVAQKATEIVSFEPAATETEKDE